MRIGVLGGTFDPPHYGHLALAKAAITALELDEVLFMPVSRNPLKRHRPSPAKHRLEMVRRLIEKEPQMAVSDQEITRGGPSYAVDTISELLAAQPAEYWFLIGTDALHDFPSWKQPEKLLRHCRLGVVTRGTRSAEEALTRLPKDLREKVDVIQMNQMDVSASELREQVSRNRSTTPWIPESVRQYIESTKLYRSL